MGDKVEGTPITLTDDCLRAVCLQLDALADIISFSKVNHQFRQAALYSLSHMSLTLEFRENFNCKCWRKVETRGWTYVLRDMANNTFSVLNPFAMQQNTALVQGVCGIKISQAICKQCVRRNRNSFYCFTEQFTALGNACASRSPTAILFQFVPLFPNLLSLQISSHCFEFDGSEQQCFCNALCAMPKLVDVSLTGYLDWKGVIKLTEKLQYRNAINVFAAFKVFNFLAGVDDRVYISDIIKVIALYPNVEEVDIPDIGDIWPLPNKRVDFTPFQNLGKLKSLSTTIGSLQFADMDLMYLVPAHLTITDLKLRFFTACATFSVGAQFLNACSSLKVFKLSQTTLFDYDHGPGVHACTFSQFLTAFELHRNLTSLEFVYEAADDHMPDYIHWKSMPKTKDVYEHIHEHFLELAARAPESLSRVHLALTPYKYMRGNEEMTRWASVVKVSRTPTVHITFGLDFEQGLAAELTSAMEQSLVNELIVNVKNDKMDGCVGTRTTTNGTRQGTNDLFRIEVSWTTTNST